MFSPANRRFTLVAIGIVSIVVIVVVGMVALFSLDLYEGEKNISQSTMLAVGAITAFAGIAINQMFIVLRFEQGHSEGQQERAYIAQEVEHTKVKADENKQEIKEIKEQSIVVNRSELKEMLTEIAKQICEDLMKPKG